ncbi:MAG: hypothetical protein AAGB10_22495, partial [Pseudomonadota bacterium]
SADVTMVAALLRADGSVAQNLHLGGRGSGHSLIEEPGTYRVEVNALGSRLNQVHHRIAEAIATADRKLRASLS